MYYLLGILAFKYIIKYFFSKYNYHSLFRSFFCLLISTLSIGICLYKWENLISNPLEQYYLASHINKLMLNYMLYDTYYFIYNKQYRVELLLHI